MKITVPIINGIVIVSAIIAIINFLRRPLTQKVPKDAWYRVQPNTKYISPTISERSGMTINECKWHILETPNVDGGTFRFYGGICKPKQNMLLKYAQEDPGAVSFIKHPMYR